MGDDYFTILGIERDATTDEIRSAYRRLSKKIHPDAQGSSALFRQVQEAYETLIDPSSRARYVAELNASQGQSTKSSTRPRTESASTKGASSQRSTGSTGRQSGTARTTRRANEFGKHCEYCGWWVRPGAGVLLGNIEGEWRVVHLDGKCPNISRLKAFLVLLPFIYFRFGWTSFVEETPLAAVPLLPISILLWLVAVSWLIFGWLGAREESEEIRNNWLSLLGVLVIATWIELWMLLSVFVAAGYLLYRHGYFDSIIARWQERYGRSLSPLVPVGLLGLVGVTVILRAFQVGWTSGSYDETTNESVNAGLAGVAHGFVPAWILAGLALLVGGVVWTRWLLRRAASSQSAGRRAGQNENRGSGRRNMMLVGTALLVGLAVIALGVAFVVNRESGANTASLPRSSSTSVPSSAVPSSAVPSATAPTEPAVYERPPQNREQVIEQNFEMAYISSRPSSTEVTIHKAILTYCVGSSWLSTERQFERDSCSDRRMVEEPVPPAGSDGLERAWLTLHASVSHCCADYALPLERMTLRLPGGRPIPADRPFSPPESLIASSLFGGTVAWNVPSEMTTGELVIRPGRVRIDECTIGDECPPTILDYGDAEIRLQIQFPDG